MNESALQILLDKAVDNKKIFGTSFCISGKNNEWRGCSGNFEKEDPFFIASTTKLFVTAIIMKFRHEGKLRLEDRIADHLPETITKGIHRKNNNDYSSQITIRHLLAHTSGIPDYFQQKNKSGDSLEKTLTSGIDTKWSFEEAIERSKSMSPYFIPGEKRKAHYSDTNFQLLGRIIEILSGKSLEENFSEHIYVPLNLTKTYLYTDLSDRKPHALYFRTNKLEVPMAMSSFGADGGIVSTSGELMTFLKAFMQGKFFPTAYFAEMKSWNKIFFPMQSGVGIHRFKLPWFFDPFGMFPEMIGHSGLSGTVAYYCEAKDLYITGTVNQIAYPDTSFRLMIKLFQKSMKVL